MNIDNFIYEHTEVKSYNLAKYIMANKTLHKYFKVDWGICKK